MLEIGILDPNIEGWHQQVPIVLVTKICDGNGHCWAKSSGVGARHHKVHLFCIVETLLDIGNSEPKSEGQVRSLKYVFDPFLKMDTCTTYFTILSLQASWDMNLSDIVAVGCPAPDLPCAQKRLQVRTNVLILLQVLVGFFCSKLDSKNFLSLLSLLVV